MTSGGSATPIARFSALGSPVAQITWVDGELRVGSEWVSTNRIREWDRAGFLEWASDEARDWFEHTYPEPEPKPVAPGSPALRQPTSEAPSRPIRSLGVFIGAVLIWGAFYIAMSPVMFVVALLIPIGSFGPVRVLVASVGLAWVSFELGRTFIRIAVGRKGASPAVQFAPAVAGLVVAVWGSWESAGYAWDVMGRLGNDLGSFAIAASSLVMSPGWTGGVVGIAGTLGATVALRWPRATTGPADGTLASSASPPAEKAPPEPTRAGIALIAGGAVTAVAMASIGGVGIVAMLGSAMGGGSQVSGPMEDVVAWGAIIGVPGTVVGLVLLGIGIVQRHSARRHPGQSTAQRARTAVVAAVILSVVGFGVFAAPSVAARFASRSVPVEDAVVDRAGEQVSLAYPGWTIERVYGRATASGSNELASTLKWAGPEVIRTSQTASFDSRYRDSAPMTVSRSVLGSPACAESFIRAFKARHPEPNLIVLPIGDGGNDIESIRWMGAKGERFRISYKRLQDYQNDLDSAGLPSWATGVQSEDWRATAATSSVTWEYLGESEPTP